MTATKTKPGSRAAQLARAIKRIAEELDQTATADDSTLVDLSFAVVMAKYDLESIEMKLGKLGF